LKPLGVFITLEGIDGTGKSTHHRLLVNHLRRRGLGVCSTREPGGTSMGERVRRILMDSRTRMLAPLAELALFYAARAQHLEDVVRPALERGEIVVSDRFNDASMAYQGYGRQLGDDAVRALDRVICGPTQPDLTLVLDLPARAALARAHEREKRRKSPRGRFETQGLSFHERVRAGYLAIARKDRQRVRVIRADRPIEKVQAEVCKLVDNFLKNAPRTKRKTR